MKNMHVLIVCETSLAVESTCPVLSRMKKVTTLWLYMLLKKWLPRDFSVENQFLPRDLLVTKNFMPRDFPDKNK